MNTGKAVGVHELSVEMVKANRLVGIKCLTRLFNVCFNRVAQMSDCTDMEGERGHP